MQKLVLTALGALLACGTAGAQTPALTDAAFSSRLGSVVAQSREAGQEARSGFLARQPAFKASHLLQDVMVAMYDAPGAGEQIVQWLRDNKAQVEFKDGLQGRSAHTFRTYPEGTVPTIYVDSAFKSDPVSYRYLGVLLAKEGSELMYKDFPESAEKRYLVAARMAETYFELGGERGSLPDFDGIKDPETADVLRVWIENAPDQGVQALSQAGNRGLADQLKEAQGRREALLAERQQLQERLPEVQEGGPAWEELKAGLVHNSEALAAVQKQLDSIEKAGRFFERFKKAETDWLMGHRVARS